MLTSEATDKIIPAFIKAEHAVGAVKKSANNPHFKSKYADLEAVVDACSEALEKNNLGYWQSVSLDGTTMITRIWHESGQWMEGYTPLIVGKNDMQGLGSASTYARRYGLMSALGIAPEDDDGNAAAKSPADAKGKPKAAEKPPAHIERAAQIAGFMQAMNDVDELEAFWDGLADELPELRKLNAKAVARLDQIHTERLALLSKEIAA